MNFIRTAFSTPKCVFHLLPHCKVAIQQLSTTTNCISKDADFAWRDLVNNPTDWCDYREDKSVGLVKTKYPDFKHKTNGTALLLNTAPNSMLAGLAGLNVGKKEDSWKDLVENPHKWWDNRPTKTNVKGPDFKHKETREGLWLNSSPKWVLPVLEGLNVGKGKKEDSWKNFVENPDEWWDNRLTKISVNAPDFRHKETGEYLWLNSSPKWVLAMVEGLNVGKGKKEDSWKNLLENAYKWLDNRSRKPSVKSPDFIHKETAEALWLHSSPKWVLAGLAGLKVEKCKKEDRWKNLVENPDKWWDHRPRKTNVKEPDFRHKETGEGLWLDSSPKPVLAVLDGLNVGKGKREETWENLVENPDKWLDNRPSKTNVKAPDFIHKETGEALWLDSAPEWVFPGPEELNLEKRKKEDSWKNLVENPDKWLDNRSRKINVNLPDFRHKETNEGLWLRSSPKWVWSLTAMFKN